MYRTLCVLALLTLQAGLVHCFSWDVVMGAKNRLAFYNEGKVTYSVTFTNVLVDWITYDPFHNRVLFTNNSMSLLSFDIATGKSQTLINFETHADASVFHPDTGLLFVSSFCKVYSYLVKPGSNHEADRKFVVDLGEPCHDIAVDSCSGYIYWISEIDKINKIRLNDSEREEVIESTGSTSSHSELHSLTIDTQTQNMYWTENRYLWDSDSNENYIFSSDLNGKQRRTLKADYYRNYYYPLDLTTSNDFIYWAGPIFVEDQTVIFEKIPKNPPIDTESLDPEQVAYIPLNSSDRYDIVIAANYAIEEKPQGIPLCNALKRLLPDYSETNDSDSLKVSTGGSLLRVNETKLSGESQVSGDTWNISVCHNYCFQGNCSVSADGQPKCRCNAGYVGVRCEVNACQAYCLHGGVCSLSEQNNPVCQCTAGYQGERCDVTDFHIKCSQTVFLLKDILSADLSSVTEGKRVKSTYASTVV